MAAARRRQRRRRRLDKGCGDDSVREAAADDGVDGGRRGEGEEGSNAVWSLRFVFCRPNFKLHEASKNLETFQENSSRLPGTPLRAVTGLVVMGEGMLFTSFIHITV
jgi:hypothetical protein